MHKGSPSIGRVYSAFLLLSLYFTPMALFGKSKGQDTLMAFRIQSPIKLDGFLTERAWKEATKISNFTQRELNEGEPATERTEVAVLYDLNSLYIGVWCYDQQPEKIIAQKMNRDFDFGGDDNFKIVIDTYNDKRNGYFFVINPNGARFDALIIDNGRMMNRDWDGVWDVATQITSEGWFAEIEIPFSTLKFPPIKTQVWGINFERNIRRKREQVLWQAWSRDAEIVQVSRAGTLIGIEGISSLKLIEFQPSLLFGFEKSSGTNGDVVKNLSGDLNYLITPTLKLNVTVHPDFAQVESDQIQINLTRFSLYYPEKRKFFLEGKNFFDFGLGWNIMPFYSRRIGLSDEGEEIPILGGIRILGKRERTTLGGMLIQTGKKESYPSTTFGVFRWKEDIFRESTFGIIGVGKREPSRYNATFGIDFLYSTYSLFGDKNFSSGFAYAESYTSDFTSKRGNAHNIFIDYPNDRIDFSLRWQRAGKNFNPEVGFLRRENYQLLSSEFRIKPRPSFLPWVNRLVFKPFEFSYYFDDETHRLQTFWSEFRPLGFITKSGEFFEFNVQRNGERLEEDFEIHEGVIIPVGTYWVTRYELQFGTFEGRPFSLFLFINWGDFYDGTRNVYSGSFTWKVNKHINLEGEYKRNDIALKGGSFRIDEAEGRIEFALNPKLFGSVFGQWNSDDEEIILNFRINWIPKPGTDLYLVVNESLDTSGHSIDLTGTTVATKVVWRFVL